MQEANESPSTRPGDARPLLVYDADCAFCVFWARYWQKLTADAVHYRPYQEAAAHHPEIPLADFQRAVQYIPPEGRRAIDAVRVETPTGGLFVVELALPFLIFCPRRLRFVAAFGILLLQSCILLTGNYNWFNLQTMLLCLLLFDDAALQRVLPQRLSKVLAARAQQRASKTMPRLVGTLALLLVFSSLVQMDMRFGGSQDL